MPTIDFTPLHRFAVGFDRMQRQLDSAQRMDETAQSYPPYNIEARGDDDYRITMAVAGFAEDQLDVTVKEDTLYISGKSESPDQETSYLHRGIAGRSFERRFELADHIQVTSAGLENGILHIDLKRLVPEEKKPRQIKIEGGKQTKAIADKAA
ncbi:MAG: Hsp20 family protein [Rhodospirillaceae bacterium]|nr:Hsp20 family protein [Rhodospirillaceae bacterium]